MHNSYSYPDANDKITLLFLNHYQRSATYWADSESEQLDILEKHINENREGRQIKTLDAGGGTGRLIPFYSRFASQILFIEPDVERIEEAQRSTNNKNIIFHNGNLEPNEPALDAEFVMSSHVIQHITTDAVPLYLEQCARNTKPNGLFALTTCHSTIAHDFFIESTIDRDTNRVNEVVIDEAQFNQVVCSGELSKLPIHFFDTDSIIRMIEDLGYTLLYYNVFHLDKNFMPHRDDIDQYVNGSEQLKSQYGRDMILLFKKNS